MWPYNWSFDMISRPSDAEFYVQLEGNKKYIYHKCSKVRVSNGKTEFIFISKSAVGNWVVIILLAIVALAVQQLTIIGAIWTSPTALAMVRSNQLCQIISMMKSKFIQHFPNTR